MRWQVIAASGLAGVAANTVVGGKMKAVLLIAAGGFSDGLFAVDVRAYFLP